MKVSTRRDFLKSGSMAALALSLPAMDFKNPPPLLSFSTLGCPDWSMAKILDFAVVNGFTGVELRGIERQLDLTQCPGLKTPEEISKTLAKFTEKGIKFSDLGASCELHHAVEDDRKKNLGDAKRFIQLAEQLKCPYIRVFPNRIPKDDGRKETIDLIVKGLQELSSFAEGKSVTVLMETHGDLVLSEDIHAILQTVNRPNVGIVWDVINMWSVTNEPVAEVYKRLKPYIYHTHIKDLKLVDGKETYVFMGRGDTPIFEAVDILSKDGYRGYYSFEWEKLWNPTLADPELAISDYAKVMRKHFES